MPPAPPSSTARRQASRPVRGGWGAKRAYLRTSLKLLPGRVPLHLGHQPPREGNEQSGKHIVLLHGWGLDADGMAQMSRALRALPGCADRHFWNITYDTHWTGFTESAAALSEALLDQPYEFEEVILIGYSMGGIVARSLVAQGFPCSHLLTLCAPHNGPLPFVYFPGPRSLAKNSPHLLDLNRNPRDIQHRDRYHLFAITYTDRVGFHRNDGIVPLPSALGQNLGAVASRHTEHLTYNTVAWYDPHWRGKHPQFMPAVLATVDALTRNETVDLSPECVEPFERPTNPRHFPLPQARRGDLLLFKNAMGLNRLITWFTRSKYYHVGIYEGDGYVVEARPRGVVRRDLNGPDGDRYFDVIPAPEGRGEAALEWARKQIGDGYDPFDVAVIILEKVFRHIHLNYVSHDKYSCGEFVAKAFLNAGLDLFPGCNPERVIPADYEKYLPRKKR